MGLVLVVLVLGVFRYAGEARAQFMVEAANHAFLPVVYYQHPPAGSYYCLEYEFGLIWTSETITLNQDGSSIYVYDPPYTGVVTGTWSYTPAIQEVGFTNFRWPTATYKSPDVLYASKYLQHVDFEIALYCQKQ